MTRQRNKSFLQLHEELSTLGVVALDEDHPFLSGLCAVAINHPDDKGLSRSLCANKIFKQVCPNYDEQQELFRRGYDYYFWGSGFRNKRSGVYTPLRQTLILLCAALNNEL